MGDLVKFPGRKKSNIITFPKVKQKVKYYEQPEAVPEDSDFEKVMICLGTSLLLVAIGLLFVYMTWHIL